MSNRKHIAESIHHLIMGFLFIIKGYEKYHHHHEIIGGLILGFGIILVLYFFIRLTLKKAGVLLNFLIHAFEALTLLLTTQVYVEERKIYLPYVTLLAAIGFIISMIAILAKQQKN